MSLLRRFPVLGPVLLASTAAFTQPAPPVREVQGLRIVHESPLTLWYRSPAKLWTDALAIGNGRLGAMIFGGPESDRFQLNDITVWSGGPMPHADRQGGYKALPAIREALRKGDYSTAQALVKANLTTTGSGDSEYWPSYETLGDLTFDHKLGRGAVTNYLRSLDLDRAITGVDFTVDGVTYHRESFSSAPDHALVSHFTADHPGSVSFTVKLSRVASATTTAEGNATLVMRGDTTFPLQPERPAIPPTTSGPRKGFPGRPARPAQPARPGNLDYEARLHVRAVGGSIKAQGDELMVQGADEATVLLTAGTSFVLDYDKAYKGADPHAAASAEMQSAAGKSYEALKSSHIADYQSFFHRVSFDLPATSASIEETGTRLKNYADGRLDPSLAVLYYQMGRYLLIASSRADNPLPSNSQGIWGDGLDLPWKCDYKSNINYQMNYWPSETANLGELHHAGDPLSTRALVKPGTRTAQTYYNAPGWAVAYTANAWGWTSPGDATAVWDRFLRGGGWLMQDVWEHYAFSRDREFLRTYYPVLKSSAEFYLGILVPDANGRLITSPSAVS